MVLIVVTAVASVTLLSLRRERQTFQAELQEQARFLLDSLSVSAADAVYFGEATDLKNIAQRLAAPSANLLDVVFFDLEGRALASAAGESKNLDIDPYGRILITLDEGSLLEWQSDRLVAGQPISVEGQVLGAVRVELSTAQLTAKEDAVRNQGISVAVSVLALTIVVALLISRNVTGPLQDVVAATQRISEGDLSQAVPITTGDELAHLARSFNDMTAELQHTIDREVAILQSALDAIITVDHEGRILVCNPSARAVFGFSDGAVGLELFSHIFSDQMRQSLLSNMAAYQREGAATLIGHWVEETAIDLNGRAFPVEFALIPIKLNQAYVYTFMARDITHRKRAEQERETLIAELENQNRELERFTYAVSHDLKSPLVTVKGFLGYLEQDIEQQAPTRIATDILRMREATEQMELLLNDLLELSRIGRITSRPQISPFGSLVEQALIRVAGLISERGVQVEVMPDLPDVFGDQSRLVEVLQNLIDNSVKFMGEQPNPKIVIGATQVGKESHFFVRDNGLGIEPRYHEEVFGLFNRLDQSIEGTGIGLTLIKRIIEVHEGRIWIESEGNGSGTTFFFTLNLTPEPYHSAAV